jgi:hypothetical protein
MNPAKSKYSPGPTPRNVTVKVDCDENGIKLDAEGTNQDGTPTHVEYSAKFDGKDYPITGTYADTVSVKRIDANTIQSKLRKKDGQLMLIVTRKGLHRRKNENLDTQGYRWAGARHKQHRCVRQTVGQPIPYFRGSSFILAGLR